MSRKGRRRKERRGKGKEVTRRRDASDVWLPNLFFFLAFSRLVGVRGAGYRGDIAVDDLEIIDSACALRPASASPGSFVPPTTTRAPPTTTFHPSKLGCDFDSDFCEWTDQVENEV